VVERRLERLEASIKKRRTDVEVARAGGPAAPEDGPGDGDTAARVTLADDDVKAIRGFTFLSQKPILHCVNVDEKAVAEGERVTATYGLGAIAARAHNADRLGVGRHRDGGCPARR